MKFAFKSLFIASLVISSTAMADVVVIVHPSNSASLDEEVVNKIFLGQSRSFPGGAEATPVDQKEGGVREEFGNKVLKKSQAQLKALWARQVFTGGAKPPKEVGGDEDVVKFVASTPGAIGYVDSSKVNKGVKVIKF